MVPSFYFPDPRPPRAIPASCRGEVVHLLEGWTRRLPGLGVGVHMIPPEAYHADPCYVPSLSHSLIRLILDRTMRVARHSHPRLNPDWEPKESTEAMEQGTAMHYLLLGAGTPPVVVKADDWRTKDARLARDLARAAGAAPILADRMEELRRCANAVLEQMRDDPVCADFFGPGRSEVTMIWREGPIWCRAMVDRLPNRPGAPMFNLKSTGIEGGANPEKYDRTMQKKNATGAVHYMRGARAVLPVPPSEELCIVYETKPPFDMSVMAPGDTLLEVAESEVKRAVMAWARARITGEWPGYGRGVHRIEAPWHMIQRAEEAQIDLGRIAA